MSDCPSVRFCRNVIFSAPNWDRDLFFSVHIPFMYEYLFYRYFVSVGQATKGINVNRKFLGCYLYLLLFIWTISMYSEDIVSVYLSLGFKRHKYFLYSWYYQCITVNVYLSCVFSVAVMDVLIFMSYTYRYIQTRIVALSKNGLLLLNVCFWKIKGIIWVLFTLFSEYYIKFHVLLMLLLWSYNIHTPCL